MTPASDRRIAFLDVDGTIQDDGERIADSTIEAVRTARANGHLVYLATGRVPAEVKAPVRDIGFDGGITGGGGFAHIGDELLFARTMPEESVVRLMEFYESEEYDYYLQSVDDLFPSAGVGERLVDFFALMQEKGDGDAFGTAPEDHPDLHIYTNVRQPDLGGIAKSIFFGRDLTAFDRVVAGLGDEFHVVTGTIPHLGTGSGEVTLAGVDKGSSILMLLGELGISPASAIGIGDSQNDLEMLDVCGVGIAMGNATDAVKARADDITTSVLDDGIWNAFSRHGLI